MSEDKYKFTANRLDNGQPITGFLCQNFNGGFSIIPKAFFASVISDENDDFDGDTEEDNALDNGLAIGGFFDVVPESIRPHVAIPMGTVIDNLKEENTIKWAKRLLDGVDKHYNGLNVEGRLNENGVKFHDDIKAFLKNCD